MRYTGGCLGFTYLMNPILFYITLVIPLASTGIDWNIHEVPNQMTITFQSGVKASYATMRVSCDTVPSSKNVVLYKTKDVDQQTCYLTDISVPLLVRAPWEPVTTKTYKKK